MRALLIIPVLLLGCTPTIDRVDRRGRETTDSALSILENLGDSPDTLREVRVETKTIVKTRVVEVESSPVINAMVRPSYSIERRGCDTVYIRDTVYLRR